MALPQVRDAQPFHSKLFELLKGDSQMLEYLATEMYAPDCRPATSKYTILTRKLKLGFEEGEPQKIVRELASWQPISIDLAVLEHAWLLEERHSLSWWDALIVAAAQTCECEVLLTEDLQHGQTFSAVRVVDPFKPLDRTPAEVLEVLGK